MALLMTAVLTVTACGKKKAPIARPTAPPPPATASTDTAPSRPPTAPEPVRDATIVPPEPVHDDAISSASLDDLNRTSPLRPVFFDLDSSDLSTEGQHVLDGNAALLKQHATWAITIEGHCDERGSAEYNLALGERRALSARAYLISLGLSADRLRTVSYGKEFPFDPGHDESAYAKNRRAHFVITAK
jgi:peptidoglycan-associated lipoprotein